MKNFFSASLVWIFSIIALLLVQFVGMIVLIFSPVLLHTIIQFGIMIMVQVANVLVVFIVCKKRKFHSTYLLKRPNGVVILKSIALGVLTFIGMYLVSQYVFVLLSYLGARAGFLDVSGWYIIPAIITTVIYAPIGEEVVFRGAIVYGLKDVNKVLAVLLSALLFALMHMSPMQTFYQFVLGCMLAVLVLRGKNVLYTVVAHGVSNIMALVSAFLPLQDIPLFHPTTIVIASILLEVCLVGVFFILKSINECEPEEMLEESTKKDEGIFGIVAFALGMIVCGVVWFSAFV